MDIGAWTRGQGLGMNYGRIEQGDIIRDEGVVRKVRIAKGLGV